MSQIKSGRNRGMRCDAPLPYPLCAKFASLLVKIIFVKTIGNQRVCFYENARPNCTMPTNLTIQNGFYPVERNISHEISNLHAEAILLKKYENYVVPANIKSVYITGAANASKITIQNEGVTIIGLQKHKIDKIEIKSPGSSLINVTSDSIDYKAGLDFTNLRLENVFSKNPIEFLPTTLKRYISMDGAVFKNVTGNYVALLHHRGQVTADNTKIIWLNYVRGTGSVTTVNDGQAFNVARLTGIFGPQYETEYEAGSIFYQSQEASSIANALILPTVLSVVVVFFSQGDKLKWRRSEKQPKN